MQTSTSLLEIFYNVWAKKKQKKLRKPSCISLIKIWEFIESGSQYINKKYFRF